MLAEIYNIRRTNEMALYFPETRCSDYFEFLGVLDNITGEVLSNEGRVKVCEVPIRKSSILMKGVWVSTEPFYEIAVHYPYKFYKYRCRFYRFFASYEDWTDINIKDNGGTYWCGFYFEDYNLEYPKDSECVKRGKAKVQTLGPVRTILRELLRGRI